MFRDEWKIIRYYSVFYIVGVLLTLLLAVLYFIPQFYYASTTIYLNIMSPEDNAAFWDSIVFLAQTMIMIILLVYLERKQKRES